jgi:type I site-specific restriction endonuclease
VNEAETRTELVDPALRAAGWDVVEASRALLAQLHAAGAGAGTLIR